MSRDKEKDATEDYRALDVRALNVPAVSGRFRIAGNLCATTGAAFRQNRNRKRATREIARM